MSAPSAAEPDIREQRPTSQASTRLPAGHEEQEPAATQHTDGGRARANVLSLAFRDLTSGRQWLLAGSVVLFLAQLATFSTLLALSRNDTCDENLRVYLALHLARAAAAWAVWCYQALFVVTPARGEEAQAARPRRLGSESLDGFFKQLSDLLLLAGVAVFILGNVYLFSTSTCRTTSPMLFYGSIAALAFGWLYVLEVVTLVVLVIFFLPLAILVLRLLGVGQKKPEVGPMTAKDFDSLPLVYYIPQDSEGAAQPTPPPKPTRPATRFSRLFRRRDRSAADNEERGRAAGFVTANLPYFAVPPSQATCPICLCDYEEPPRTMPAGKNEPWRDGEQLILLPCRHVLHRDCSKDWFVGVSGRCPVCQQPAFEGAKPATP